MQLTVENFYVPRSYAASYCAPGTLREMYESPDLFNEGIVSFQYPVLVASDEEMEQFLGSLVHSVTKAVGNVAKDVGKVASKIDKIIPVSKVAKGIGSVVSAVDKVVPVSLLTSTLAAPLKAGLGAVQAAAEGKNVFQGAIRSLVPDIGTRFLVDTVAGVASGKSILSAAEAGMKAGIGDVKKSLQFAAMVAPFVPGIGTGVAAALGAANALANGEPITQALIDAARDAVPGGAIAQAAFDVGAKLIQGKKLSDALLEEARKQLPGGPAAQAAFDVALALAKGQNIQQAALQATGKLLPKSPFAESALNFVSKVASGQNIQNAALSAAGSLVYNKIQQAVPGQLAGAIKIPGGVKLPGDLAAPRVFRTGMAIGPAALKASALAAARARATALARRMPIWHELPEEAEVLGVQRTFGVPPEPLSGAWLRPGAGNAWQEPGRRTEDGRHPAFGPWGGRGSGPRGGLQGGPWGGPRGGLQGGPRGGLQGGPWGGPQGGPWGGLRGGGPGGDAARGSAHQPAGYGNLRTLPDWRRNEGRLALHGAYS